LKPGDRVVLRRGEIVPADCRLLDADAAVDYRFLTGEEQPTLARVGERVRAGGRAASAMRLCVLREASESQLASLWASPVFGLHERGWLAEAGVRFARWFTVAAIGLAAIGAIAWWPDMGAAASVATAVLIVACPCALTLAAPITLGTAMGELGRRGLYLKEAAVVLDLSRIDTVVFDKTGTLTAATQLEVTEASRLSDRNWSLIRRLALESSHPVSLAIAKAAREASDVSALIATLPPPKDVREVAGEGVTGIVAGRRVAIGSARFVAAITHRPGGLPDRTHVTAGGEVGWVRLAASVRPGMDEAAGTLAQGRRLMLVSGDADTERARWSRLFGHRLHFRQSPSEKLAIVAAERAAGRRVLMVGDGLNDAGALKAADVGLAVCDDSACVVPACDGVIGGDRLAELPAILRFARRARHIVVTCLAVSLVYNVIGLTLALWGALTPLASAILMPVSSLTIVGLSAGGVRWFARRLPQS
jgi:Cu+-exporting ATPase